MALPIFGPVSAHNTARLDCASDLLSMARELARKLAAESAALAKAASLNIEAIEVMKGSCNLLATGLLRVVIDLFPRQDESTAAEQWQQLQEEALFAAEEAAKVASDAAKSDAAVRNARKISAEKAVMAQLRKLRQENEALKAMVMEMAANKDEARDLHFKGLCVQFLRENVGP